MAASQRLVELAKPSLALSRSEACEVEKLAEQSAAWLSLRAILWVEARRQRPILVLYGSDSTPCSTRRRYQAEIGDALVRRAGRQCQDLLVQRLYLIDGDFRPITVLCEPRVLLNITAATHCRALHELMPNPRELGHDDLLITHCVWDGALFSALRRMRMQYFEAQRLHHEETKGPEEAHRLSLLHWESYVPCMAHAAHNGLKWGVRDRLSRETLRSCFIAMESLRNGYSVLDAVAPAWVAEHLDFADWPTDCVQELWVLLGFTDTVLEERVELQIRFSGGKLFVAEAFRDDALVAPRIHAILMAVWRLRTFSDSRWQSLGAAARGILGAAILGIESLVSFAHRQPRTSTYYIRGFCAHFTTPARELVAIMGSSSFVADGLLSHLLEDYRLAMHIGAIDEDMLSELTDVGGLNDDIWFVISDAVGMAPRALRSDAMSSALCQAGYVCSKFRMLRQRPWSLLMGDIPANLEAFKAEPEPLVVDELSRKIWVLLQRDFNRADLITGMELLRETSWTTQNVEQGHSKASVLAKLHVGYDSNMVRARAQVATCAALFSEDKVELQALMLEQRAARLASYHPEKYHGKALYMKRLREAAHSLQVAGGGPLPSDLSRRVVRGRSRQWAALDPARRSALEAEAREEASRVEQERLEESIAVQQSAELLRARAMAAQEARDRPCGRLDSCRLHDEAREDFNEYASGRAWTRAHVQRLREARRQPCGEVEDRWKAIFAELDHVGCTTSLATPLWVRQLCRHRHFFGSCILQLQPEAGGEDIYLATVFATMSPALACFVRVQPLEHVERHLGDGARWQHAALDAWEHEFQIDEFSFIHSDEEWAQRKYSIFVLAGVLKLGSWVLASDQRWESFGFYQTMFHDLVAEGADEQGQEPTTTVGTDWASDPRLLNFWDFPDDAADARHAEAQRQSEAQQQEEEDDDQDPSELARAEEALLDEFWAKRAELIERDSLIGAEGFHISLRGGRWLLQQTGEAFDSLRAQARAPLGTRLCDRFKLNHSATFSLKAFGETLCQHLAQVWVDKMSWLLASWIEAGAEDAVGFSLAAASAAWPEPEAHVAAIEAAGAPARKRLAQIRQLGR